MDQSNFTPEQKEKYQKSIDRMKSIFDADLAKHLTDTIVKFSGNFDVLEKAIGALIVGQLMGWRVLTLMHSANTIKKYEKVLGINFKSTLPWDDDRITMPEYGALAKKSVALDIVEKVGSFWKVVRGETDDIKSSSDKKEMSKDF